jgi:hypothetical protein
MFGGNNPLLKQPFTCSIVELLMLCAWRAHSSHRNPLTRFSPQRSKGIEYRWYGRGQTMQDESQQNEVGMGSEEILPTIGLIRFDTAPSVSFVSQSKQL